MSVKRRRLIMVVNSDRFFLSHRKAIALAARSEGWNVSVVTCDTGRGDEIRALGLDFRPLPMRVSRIGVKGDLATLRILERIYREEPDAVIHHVGMKLILIGGAAARRAGAGRVVNAVCGLGSTFAHKGAAQSVALMLLRRVLDGFDGVTIFQNHDDERLLAEAGVPLGRREYLKGSGIDLDECRLCSFPTGSPAHVIFTGRMLREKGVEDFCAAAEMLRDEMEGSVVFDLYGGLTDNRGGLTQKDMKRITDGCYIRWHGFSDDIPARLAESVVMVFPSYYREGLPKSLIEASAVGRAIITTDSVGCRDTVEDGVNGHIVAPHSPDQIAAWLREMLADMESCREMGLRSREMAERDYDIRDIVAAHLRIYEMLAE